MRTRTMILSGALLLVFAGIAQAQQQPTTAAASQAPTATPVPVPSTSSTPKFGKVDFGFRGDDLTGDAARYQRFRDLRQGAYLDQFKFTKDTEAWIFRASAGNVGYHDQRYSAEFVNPGKLVIKGDWNQIPLFISDITSTLYRDNGQGVLSIDDSIQTTLQNAGTPTSPATYNAMTNALNNDAQRYDLRSRRDVGSFNLAYTVNQEVDVKFDLRNTNRNGYNLMSFGFGTSPGLNPALEFGVPTDDRTTDLRGSVEFANQQGLLSLGYNASWFENYRPTVKFDNPLRATDISGGPSSGLAVMWPTNHSASFDVNGSYKLPARSRASAYLSVGRWNQDEDLVSPTVNTALVAPPLERASAETRADILSTVLNFTSRPNQYLWLNANYRYYDYANKTPIFDTTALIGDWALGTAHWENEPSSLKRKTVDLEGSISAVRFLNLNFGFNREDVDRTFRIYENTAEDTYRVGFDTTGNQYVTLRVKFEHGDRNGSGFQEHLLEEVGEQPDTRHFDVANRTRDRVTTMLSITPTSILNLNAAFSDGQDTYGETGFGLRDNDNRAWSVGFDLVPSDRVSFGINYGEEKYTAMQYSRTANPLSPTDQTFNDPTRDWWLDQSDKVKTFTTSADFLKVFPKTDIRLGYDISDANATYVYNMKPEQRVFTTVPLTQLVPLKNKLTDGRVDIQYYIRPNLAFGGAYWYEAYKVDDFALDPTTLTSLNPVNGTTGVFANTIYSGYLYRPYTAHTGWLRMTVLW